MGRKRAVKSLVYVRGDRRIVINLANNYICQTTPDQCTITNFEDFKVLTPQMVMRAAEKWGYELDTGAKRRAS